MDVSPFGAELIGLVKVVFKHYYIVVFMDNFESGQFIL